MSTPLHRRTRILALRGDQGLRELGSDTSPILTTAPSLAAGTLANASLLLQVVPKGFRLAWGANAESGASLGADAILSRDSVPDTALDVMIDRAAVEHNCATVLDNHGHWTIMRALTWTGPPLESKDSSPKWTSTSLATLPGAVAEHLAFSPSIKDMPAAMAKQPNRCLLLQSQSGLTLAVAAWFIESIMLAEAKRGITSARCVHDTNGSIMRALVRNPCEAAARSAAGANVSNGAAQKQSVQEGDVDQFDADESLQKLVAQSATKASAKDVSQSNAMPSSTLETAASS